MGQSLLVSSNGTSAFPGGSNGFVEAGDAAFIGSTVITSLQNAWCSSGVIKTLRCVVSVNATVTTACVVTTAINGTGGGNCTISIPVGTTGSFVDSTHSDQVTISGGSSRFDGFNINNVDSLTLTINEISAVFIPASGTFTEVSSGGAATSFTTASTTTFWRFGGTTTNSTTEATVQAKTFLNAVLSRFFVYIAGNNRASITTFGSRINTANGNSSISVPATTAGLFVDGVNTDTLSSAGTLVNFFQTNGTGTLALTVPGIGAAISTTDNTSVKVVNTSAGIVAGLTRDVAIGGTIPINIATESTVQNVASIPFTLSKMAANISANAATGAGTLTFRKNTANGNLSISIAAAATGFFTDSTHSDNIVATDVINYQIVGGTGGTTTYQNITAVMSNLPAGNNGLMLVGCGT